MLSIKNILKIKTTRGLHIRSIARILSIVMSLSIAPIEAFADSSYSSSAGSSSNNGGGNSGTFNYCSAPAYSLYLASDDWASNVDLTQGTNEQSSVARAIMEGVTETFKYKYPSWGTNYIYLVPTFETAGGTGHASEMSAVSQIIETNSSYTGWSVKQDSARIVKITEKSNMTEASVKNALTLGRSGVYNLLSRNQGKMTFTQLAGQIDKQVSYEIFKYIVSGGPDAISKRAGHIAYMDNDISWAGIQTAEDKMYIQAAGYLALMTACYQYAGADKAAWRARIEASLNNLSGDDSGTLRGFPILAIDRALGVSINNGAMNSVMDGIDLYSYATGMRNGAWKNLRDGWKGSDPSFKSMAWNILNYLDSLGSRSIPIKSGYNSAGGIGPTMSLLGFNGYSPDIASNVSSVDRYGLWAKLQVDGHLGYNYVYAGFLVSNPETKGRQDIETDDPKKVTLPKGSTTIGKDIPVHFEIDQTKSDEYKAALEKMKMIDNYYKTTVGTETRWQLSMNIRREVTPEGNGGINKIVDEDGSTIEPQEEGYRNLTKLEIENTTTRDTEALALDFEGILGLLEKGKTMEFIDKTTDDPILTKRLYEYYSTAYLRCEYRNKQTGKWEFFTNKDSALVSNSSATKSDAAMNTDDNGWMKLDDNDGYAYKEFEITANDYHYDSTPVGLSEVKQGEPMNEEWEAMSGTVTTAPLYFASGGSEFAVTIDATPTQGSVNRKYSVDFPSWKDTHYGTTGPCDNCGAHPEYTTTSTNSDGSTSTTTHPAVYCHCSVGSSTQSWTQDIKYSYMKINTVKVWRVKTSAVTGMKELTPMNSSEHIDASGNDDGQVVAQIIEGDDAGKQLYTSIFTDTTTEDNGTASTGSLAGGRLRFTEMPEDGGSVNYKVANNAGSGTWGEGPGSCSEKDAIPPRRNSDVKAIQSRSNNVYVQSDYVILHTKEGDMVLNYSETTGHSDNLTSTIDATRTSADLWWNNNLSPAGWKADEINQFWYNGDYTNPNSAFTGKTSKYTFKSNMISPISMEYRKQQSNYPKSEAGKLSGSGLGPTKISAPTGNDFNEYPMGVRWEKAYPKLTSNQKNYKEEGVEIDPYDATGTLKMWRQFNPLLTHPNGTYDIGNSSLLYERILSYYDPATGEVTSPLDSGGSNGTSYSNRYSDSSVGFNDEATYAKEDGKSYLVVHSGYSAKISDVNDIVIHNPVSSEKSYVISLPDSRDQRTDRSKTLGSDAISSMTDAQSETLKTTNPDYHNNLVFNGFVESEKANGGTLGWKSGIGSALGWEMDTEKNQPNTNVKAYFGADVNKGIIIGNNGYGKVMYYQDIPITAGDNYVLTYKVENIEGSNKAKVELKYLDNKDNYVSNDKAVKLRVLITQETAGKSLVHEIVVKNMSRAGFIPVTTTFYDINYANIQDSEEVKYLDIDSPYHYLYKDVKNGTIVDSLTMPADEVLGSALSPIDSSTVDKTRTYRFMAYYYCYTSGAEDDVQDGLIKMRGLTSGEEVNGTGTNINQVVGKVYQYEGQSELFTALDEGNYYIEAYGADGGSNEYASSGKTSGGKGGYTSGIIHLNRGDTIAINVGGKGEDSKVRIDENTTLGTHNKDGVDYLDIDNDEAKKTVSVQDAILGGGYNGGARSGIGAGSGGGATTVTKYSHNNSASDYILIAGGGGGAGNLDGSSATIGDNNLANTTKGKSPISNISETDELLENYKIDLNKWEELSYGSGGAGATGGTAETLDERSLGGTSYKSSDIITDKIAKIPKTSKPTTGNGKVTISYMKYFGEKDTSSNTDLTQATIRTIASKQYNNNAPSDAYITSIKKPSGGSSVITDDEGVSKVDTFINLDYGFSVYFPNEGDFKEDSSLHGISKVTSTKGMGYKDNMDTTEWTYAKYVQFPFNVMHNGTRYATGEKIYLDVNKEYFDFYAVLGNSEQSSAKIHFVSLAINNQDVNLKGQEYLPDLYNDGKVMKGGTKEDKAREHPEGDVYSTPMDNAKDATYIIEGKDTHGHNGHYQKNKTHTGVAIFKNDSVAQEDSDCYSYKQYIEGEAESENSSNNNFKRYEGRNEARHSADETDIIDVVGRIGNYIINDVGDPTFASFFKKPDGTGSYLVPGAVPTVDSNKQNNFVGDVIDIRGVDTSSSSSSNPNYNYGNSKNTLSNDIRGNYLVDKWTNMQGEKKRPGNGYGDSNDPKGQTTYNQKEVLGSSNDNHNAFLNTWGRKATATSPMEGLHDNSFGQLAYKINPSDNTSLPLTNTMNNLPELKTQNLKLGYPVYQDIQTIGDYFGGSVQVSPTYYALDLDSDPENPILIPVDIYMAINDSYLPINIFGASQVETEEATTVNGTKIKGKMVSTVTNIAALNNTPVKDSSGKTLRDTYGNELKYRYIFDNKQFIDWDRENVRRNASIGVSQNKSAEMYPEYAEIGTTLDDGSSLFYEKPNTVIDGQPSASHEWKTSKEVSGFNNYGLPFGLYYAIGNNQILNLNARNRTYVGANFTYGSEINRIREGSLDTKYVHTTDYDTTTFMQEAQRWHFTNNLPSSAVAVKAGDKCNSINIADLRKDSYVILTALDIKAVGSVWTLQYAEGGENDRVSITQKDGTTKKYNISNVTKGKVVYVTSANKSAKDDRAIVGTH